MNRNITTVRPDGKQFEVDIAVEVPQQQLRVEVHVAEFAGPAHPPGAERLDDRSQLLARLGEFVGDLPAVVVTCHHSRADELDQPLGEQRGRHRRDAAAQIVEAVLPDSISLITSRVQRSSSSSIAFATGQNWWYEEPMPVTLDLPVPLVQIQY